MKTIVVSLGGDWIKLNKALGTYDEESLLENIDAIGLLDESECETKIKNCKKCYEEKNYHDCDHEPKTKIEKLPKFVVFSEDSTELLITKQNRDKINEIIDYLNKKE